MLESDILIVGGGIVGLTLARELIARGAEKIIILEKENEVGLHASGRNSGVLHAGIYYPPNTLKAQLCLKGNLMLQAYCEQNKLPLQKVGKVIVAKNEAELPAIKNLYDRATQNGAKVDILDEKQLAEIEPSAKTHHQALHSHYTAIVDNKAILKSLLNELMATKKVNILLGTQFKRTLTDFVIETNQGKIRFKQFINAAGSYADTVAHQFEVGKNYLLVPFKGIYKKLIAEKSNMVNGNIYPVPNLENPFLGVHFTKNISGDLYVGPTAIPAFGRENYGVLKGIDRDIFKIIRNEILLFFSNTQFRHVALEEPKKYFAKYFFDDAKCLVKELKPEWLLRASKVGIRPQLISVKENKLMMDFLIIKEKNSLHILNAISPAFTSSMAFAKYLVDQYLS